MVYNGAFFLHLYIKEKYELSNLNLNLKVKEGEKYFLNVKSEVRWNPHRYYVFYLNYFLKLSKENRFKTIELTKYQHIKFVLKFYLHTVQEK